LENLTANKLFEYQLYSSNILYCHLPLKSIELFMFTRNVTAIFFLNFFFLPFMTNQNIKIH